MINIRIAEIVRIADMTEAGQKAMEEIWRKLQMFGLATNRFRFDVLVQKAKESSWALEAAFTFNTFVAVV